MTTWTVLQIIFDLIFLAGGLLIWARLSRPAKDDPRLSRGLQLLQSKIAVLEDLSDRTDTQVKQLSMLLEQKGREVQEYIHAAQEQIYSVERSIQKSLEVSKIFQDKIPHKEIIERQNTIKYIQAARMAHQGLSIEEIAEKVDIPRSELEFIVKVNRNKLMFSEEHLPQWAKESLEFQEQNGGEESGVQKNQYRDLSQVFENFSTHLEQKEDIKKIEDAFKEAVEESKKIEEAEDARRQAAAQIATNIGNVVNNVESSLATAANQIKNTVKEKIQSLGEEIFAKDEATQIIEQGNKKYKIRPFTFKKFDEEEIDENMKI